MDAIQTAVPACIAKKLLAVMAEASYIRKDKKNEFHKYNYASEQAIKETLHPILVKHGLLFLPVGCEPVSEAEIVTAKGNKERIVTVRCLYRWVDAETGEASDVLYSMGTGSDSSDKAIYKGLTGAIKYILTGTFLIPTGDDPERDERGKQQQQTAKQREVVERKTGKSPISAEYLKYFQDIKAEIGPKLYYEALNRHNFKHSTEIPDTGQARQIYKEMGEAKKAITAASHGEGADLNEKLFNSLPDTSRAKLFIVVREKIAEAVGSKDTAIEEYERIRRESSTQWACYEALLKAHEFYANQSLSTQHSP